MAIQAPINLQNWINENRHLLKPPVGNQQVYKLNEDFIVMIVGGPNSRNDFHFNEGEELFYQLEGTVTVKIIDEDKMRDIVLGPGDMFLLPPRTPHSPRRGPDTIGLVIERYRVPAEQDGFMWFCENCGNKVYEEFIPVNDIVKDLPVLLNKFHSSEELKTCKKCGTMVAKR